MVYIALLCCTDVTICYKVNTVFLKSELEFLNIWLGVGIIGYLINWSFQTALSLCYCENSAGQLSTGGHGVVSICDVRREPKHGSLCNI